MNITPPNCPKCGHAATAPVRASMSAMPYQCPHCHTAFNLVIAMSNPAQLREAYADTPADELVAGAKCKIVFPQP